jgi:Tfp pilus assembly protein PilF
MYAMSVWNGIRALGINYVSDPWKSSENDILDQIQYPRETLASRTGDCDDSSVLLCAALENIGIRTKLIGTNDHVFMMFDTEFNEKNGYMVSMNPKDYVIHEGRVWIPLETTMINEPFVKAWTSGAAGYHDRVAKGEKLELIDVRKAKETFPPANLPPAGRPSTPPSERIVQLISRDLTDYSYYQSQLVSADLNNLASSADPNAKLKQAITLAKAADYDAAVTTLGTPATAGAWNTLGNIYLLKNELPQAQEAYQKALELDNSDGGVYLNFGLARFLADDTTGAVESFQAAIAKFDSPDQAYAVLGIDKMQEALGMRAADAGEKRVAKADIFALLNRSVTALPTRQAGTVQADRVRQRYKDQQNKYVFGGRRGADPTQIASIKEFLYWKE